SAAPPVRYANVYGIDMPSREELIASGRTEEQVRVEIGADALIYQDLEDLKKAFQAVNPAIANFETSCFDGCYITGDITAEYLTGIEDARNKPAAKTVLADDDEGQMDLNLVQNATM